MKKKTQVFISKFSEKIRIFYKIITNMKQCYKFSNFRIADLYFS